MRRHETEFLTSQRTPRFDRTGRISKKLSRKMKPRNEYHIKQLDARIGRAECRRKLDALKVERARRGN